MRTIAASLLFALGLVASAEAAPNVLLCADDGGDGSVAATQQGLKASMAFGMVDTIDCSQSTPTIDKLKMYDAVLTFTNFGYFDQTALGNVFADYVDAGGGVVDMLFGLDGFDALNLMGRWEQGGYDCILPGDYDFQGVQLKAQPNDPNSPIVMGVGGITADFNAIGGLNKNKGATSVWDWTDGTTAVCKMQIGGHDRVDLGFYPGLVTDNKPGASVTLMKNALLYVAHGFNPLKGMPNPAAFADTAVGAVSNKVTVTYTNTAMVNQTVTGITVGGTHPNDFLIVKSPQLPVTLASMGTISFDVVFPPTAAGGRSAKLSAAVMGQMASADVALSGNAIPAAIKVTPYPIAMGGTQINVPVMKTITIANQGNVKVNVQAVSITMGQTVYSISGLPNFPVALIGGGSFQATVTFNPNQNGTFPGQLTVMSDDPNSPTINIPIGGCAGPSGIQLDAQSIAYGNVNIGATFYQPINITNIGCADLKVTDIQTGGTNAGDFVIDKMMAIGSIGANASQPFGAGFKPTMMGQRTGTVTVFSDAGNKVVTVFGSGTTSMATVMPMMVDFGQQRVNTASMGKPVTIGNVGNGTLKVMAINFGGMDASSFALTGMTMPPFSIAGGQNNAVSVLCKPTAVGALVGKMTVTTDVGDVSVDLACAGTAPSFSINPTSLDFGQVAVQVMSPSQAITISNKGTADLNIDQFDLVGMDSGDFISKDMPAMLPLVIKPNMDFTFHVSFTPAANKMESAEFDLSTDDPMNKTVKIPLTGTGIQKQITVTPMSLAFGVVMVGTVSAEKAVTITNSGDAAITVNTITIGGPGAANYSVDMKGPLMIDVGKNAMVKVKFSPLIVGAANAMLTIAPDMLVPVVINLTGTGGAPSLSVNPSTFDFGPIEVGMSSEPNTFALKNGGTGPLEIGTISVVDSAFVIDQSATKMMLMGGEMTTFSVTYTPPVAMPNMSRINIVLKGQSNPIAQVTVTGSGVEKMVRGCGCRLGERPGERAPLPLLLVGAAFAVLALRRRRRG
jgi:Cep192 domain 4